MSSSTAAWWQHALLWVLLVATLPLVNLRAAPQPLNTGATILLSPFVLVADAGVSIARARGAQLPEGTAAWPHESARGLGAAIYGFFGLWMSYRLALRFAKPAAAFLATVAIWLASSLPVFLYVQPFTTYALAMFAAALVLTTALSVGANASRWRWLAFVAAVAVSAALLFGGQTRPAFSWADPRIFAATFSMAHGAFVWTPVLLVATLGLGFAIRRQSALGAGLLVASAVFVYLVAAFDHPAGEVAFGNRYLIPLIPVFVCGLAALIDAVAGSRGRAAWAGVLSVAVLMIAWNLGLILQWGTGLIPADKPLDLRQAAANQWTVVPRAAKEFVVRYINERKGLVNELEGGARE